MQIVCRHTNERSVRETLGKFDLADKARKRTNHVLVELTPDDPTADILKACREHAYAYLRVVAWEKGGGLERTGDATCVAGLEGQPIKPITMTLDGERANLEHALFGTRNGLVVARAKRQDDRYNIDVARYRVRDFKVASPEVIVDSQFHCAPMQWLSDFHSRHMDMDQFVPLMRATLRKVDCVFCGHCHYCEVSEDREKEES